MFVESKINLLTAIRLEDFFKSFYFSNQTNPKDKTL